MTTITWQILLVPIMMFADYFLTIIAAIQRDRKYSQHIKIQHYELNPLWQESVANKRWINRHHIASTLRVFVLLMLLLVLDVSFGALPDFLLPAAMGCILCGYCIILARHLSNLLIFQYVTGNPDTISGEIVISPQLVTAMSLYEHMAVAVPITLIAVVSGGWFAYGAVAGALFLVALNLSWLLKARKQEK